ncbi:hypothetical protein Tco_0040569 [Tanacetum coccineum]
MQNSQNGLDTPRFTRKRSLLCKQLRKVFNFKQSKPDLASNTDEEIDEQEVGSTINSTWQRYKRFLMKQTQTLTFEPWNRHGNVTILHKKLSEQTDLCEQSKKRTQSSQVCSTSKCRLNLLLMDLCGPMRDASIKREEIYSGNCDDYLRYTWTHFSTFPRDETPEVLKEISHDDPKRNLQAPEYFSVRTAEALRFYKQTRKAILKEERNMSIKLLLLRTPNRTRSRKTNCTLS